MPSVRAPETTAAAILDGTPDEAAIRTYERVGAIIVRGLIGPSWIDHLRACYAEMAETATVPYAKGQPPPDARKLTQRHQMWRDDERFRRFLFESPIARASARLMRSDTAQLYEDILITEPPGQRAEASWHQDEPTWPVRGRKLSSVWFSLEPVEAETGAMRFVAGSHNGPLYHPKFITAGEAGDDVRFWTGGAFPDINGAPDAFTIAITDADVGDAIVFHPRAIHTAYGSSDQHARRSFTIRFLGDDVRWQPKQRIYHRWMHDLGLKEGDKINSPRLPVVFGEG
jgi:ectoine hydroxylase-related dioxygenase (phytanoyl-CoA dioxygenase family)